MADLIACVYPFQDYDGKAEAVIEATVNCSRRVRPKPKLGELQGRQSRETTASLDEDDDHQNRYQPGEVYPGLHFTFSQPPKGGRGFVFGTNPSSCDVVLPRLLKDNGQPLISHEHLYITFNEQRRLMVRDISSRGTIVTYDDKGGGRRRNFKWIIGGHEVPDDYETIVIEILPNLKFQIVPTKDHLFPGSFFKNVDHFLNQVAANGELPLGALGINSALTTAPMSGRDTPNLRNLAGQDPIVLKQEKLGHGSFSVVSRVWDVSTGLEHACKKFRNLKASDWRQEAHVMRKISHVSVIWVLSMLVLTLLQGAHHQAPI
jgi:hypothetical protein